MPTVTRVEVTDDMSIANVFVTIMGTPGQQTAALNALRHSAGLMRTRLTKMLSIRQTPYLQFHFDDRLKKELALLETLEQVARENAELDRKRIEQGGEPEGTELGSGEPQSSESRSGQSQSGESQSGEPRGNEPPAGEPQPGEPQRGEPQPGEPSSGENETPNHPNP